MDIPDSKVLDANDPVDSNPKEENKIDFNVYANVQSYTYGTQNEADTTI